MSLKYLEAGVTRRTSQRHKIKMMKSLDQYKISNPYKTHKSLDSMPAELSLQLKNVDYLSRTTISMLKISKDSSHELDLSTSLLKMTNARKLQQQKYSELFTSAQKQAKEDLGMVNQAAVSVNMAKEECIPEEVIATSEYISLGLQPIDESLVYRHHQDELNLLESEMVQNREPVFSMKEHGITLMEVQYEHYFVN